MVWLIISIYHDTNPPSYYFFVITWEILIDIHDTWCINSLQCSCLVVTSIYVPLKGSITCYANYYFDEIILTLVREGKLALKEQHGISLNIFIII